MWVNSKVGQLRIDQLAVLGCGLIGCSFAAAAKKAGIVRTVVGYSKSPTTVKTALDLGHIDQGADSAMQAVAGSDLVLIAVPVSAIEAMLRTIKFGLMPEALVMDVGSTKRDIAQAAHNALGDQASQFVPAHPIAGKDANGPAAADANLFRGRTTVLTPSKINHRNTTDKAQDVWEALGANVLRMTAQHHDASLAAVSHMPHLLAFAYMNSIVRQPRSNELLELAGTGFRDFSRIAGSEPAMWRDIFSANRDELQMQISLFKQHLTALETALQENNTESIENLIARASHGRRKWQASDGAQHLFIGADWEGQQ